VIAVLSLGGVLLTSVRARRSSSATI